ncbi:MAG: aminopeptidase [Fusobacteria bacterium]|nr:aminopeptidase [Fusobacteriota bacterium]
MEVNVLAKKYIDFISECKTEMECVEYAERILVKNEFVNIDSAKEIKAGDRIYSKLHSKNIIAIVVGSDDIEKGCHLAVSHIDAPRLDLKGRPFYEEHGIAMAKTHYFGGIKKYQWTAIPLALHGVVALKSGELKTFVIGEDCEDPVFTIIDLLPHLDGKVKRDKKMPEVISGEELQILFATTESESEKDPIVKFIENKIKEEYGIELEDLQSADLEIVPAGRARFVGIDSSLIGGYAHDDRSCAFAALQALISSNEVPKKTTLCYWTDKEEVGSQGRTGLASNYLEYVLGELLEKMRKNYSEQLLRRILWSSFALSADVTAAVDPIYAGVHDLKNAAYINKGASIQKFTGHGGKYNASEASIEFSAFIRKLACDNQIDIQFNEMGKVDEGGGGTVAHFLESKGISTIDCGVPVLSMHSPFEVISKKDLSDLYKLVKAFYTVK